MNNDQFDRSFQNGIFGGDHTPSAAPQAEEYTPAPNLLPNASATRPFSPRRQLASIALAVSFITLFATVIQLVLIFLIDWFAPELAQADWYIVTLSCLPMYLVSMPLSLLLYAIADTKTPEKKKLSIPAWLGLLAICFALTYVGSLIGSAVNSIIEVFTGEPVRNDLNELTTNTPLWANLLFLGILAPIMEEIFYRKLVIDRLTVFGDLPAILISGLLFGLIHGNFGQFFYAAIVGVVFGFIYLRTGRLRYSIALHMAINLIGGVYTSEVLKHLDIDAFAASPTDYILQNPTPVLLFLFYLCFLLLCFVTAPIALALLWKHIRFRKADAPLTSKQWCKAIFLNPAVWLCLGTVLLLFLA